MNYIDEFDQVPMRKYWRAIDAVGKNMATGREDLLLLKAMIMANRPTVVVETGTHRGWGTISMLEALYDERPVLVEYKDEKKFEIRKKYLKTIEYSQNLHTFAQKNVEKFMMKKYAHFHVGANPVEVDFELGSSAEVKYEDWEPIKQGMEIDFAFIDCGARSHALEKVVPYMRSNGIILIHDAHDREESYSLWLKDYKARGLLKDFAIIPSERGMAFARVR